MSISIEAQVVQVNCARALDRTDPEQLLGREDPSPARLTAGDALDLAELLERVDPHVGVGADAERDRSLANRGNPEKAVAEVGLGRRADADPRAGRREEVELLVARVRCMDDRRLRGEAARVGEELDRAASVLREALLDLAWLLVRMDVEGQLLAGCVPADLLQPGPRAGAHGVGGKADGDSGGAECLDLVEVGSHGGLSHAIETAALVCGMEEHDAIPTSDAASAAAKPSAAPR